MASVTKTQCQSKNPEGCKYHGVNSPAFTAIAKQQLILARQIHQVTLTRSREENLSAIEALKEAELNYYATEEGRNNLLSHIESTTDYEQKELWRAIIQNADMKRELDEMQADMMQSSKQRSSWEPPPPALAPTAKNAGLSMSWPLTLGSKSHILASGSLNQSDSYQYTWDTATGSITYEIDGDVDSMRVLGRASTPDKVEEICARWHMKQHA